MYKILELEVLGALPVIKYTLNQQSGLYNRVNNTANEEPKGLNDLIYSRLMKITKVKRDVDNVIFEIGTRIESTVFIDGFKFIKNALFVTNNNIVKALSAVNIYVAPVVQPVATTSDLAAMEALIIRDNRPIKLGCASAPFEHNSNENLTTFLKNFIRQYNSDNNTNYADTGRMQTEAGKRRSLGDIFMICKYYYPTCTLRDVIQALYIDLVTLVPNLGSLICSQINKRVWWLYTQPRFSSPENNDEYGHNKQWYLDQLALPVETVVEEEQPSANMTVFNKIKTTFKPGVKFKIMSTGKIAKVSSTEFYNGIGKILIINGDGKRLIVYDKVKNKQAEIVR